MLDVGNDEVGPREDVRVRVGDGDAEAAPVEQLAVVLAVAAPDRLRRGESHAVRDELETGALADVGMRKLEEVGERLRNEERSREARLEDCFELVERVRVADGDELRRLLVQPFAQVAD